MSEKKEQYKLSPIKTSPQPKKPTITSKGNLQFTSRRQATLQRKPLPVRTTTLSKSVRSRFAAASKNISTQPDQRYSLVEKVIIQALKKRNESHHKKEDKEKARQAALQSNVKNGFIQDYLPIQDIQYGLVHTTDGRYVKILEISPINFFAKSDLKRNELAENFRKIFRVLPAKVQIKVTSDRNDPRQLISNIKSHEQEDELLSVKLQRQDLIQKILYISSNASISRRYFLCFQYVGKSKPVREIAEEMMLIESTLDSILSANGNCVLCESDNYNYNTLSILYYLLNRKSYRSQTYDYRYQRLLRDAAAYNDATGQHKDVQDIDLISSRGLSTYSRSCIRIDGQYQTWLTLKEKSHNPVEYAGWINSLFSFGDFVDLDIDIKRLPRESTIALVSKYNQFKVVSAREKRGNAEKYTELMNSVNNNQYVLDCMNNNDEDLFNVCIIINIRADSLRALEQRRSMIVKLLKSNRRYVEDTFLNAESYFKMTLPLLYFDNDIFSRNARNYLSSSLASLYPFTSPEWYDPTGFLIGVTQNNSIVAINNFNTQFYQNGNMMILGTSGSGKTFTEQLIGYGMYYNGIRVFYILPVKGFEYIPGCNNIGGSYIPLGPGFQQCINWMEIHPETQIDMSTVSDDATGYQASLLAKKASAITTGVQLLMLKEPTPMTMVESAKLNQAIVKVYGHFGITDDNRSIFTESGLIKEMPITSDLYDELTKMPGTERLLAALDVIVNGTCKNMDGQTNVDLSNNYTVIDVDEQVIGEDLLPWFIFVAFDCVYDFAKSSRTHFDAIFLDEVWKIMSTPAAKQVKMMVKLIRGYAGCVVLATQDIFDFLNTEFGVSVLANTEIRLFLNLKDTECDRVASIIHLTDEDKSAILGFSRGQGLLLSRGDKIIVNIEATPHEVEVFTTDPNILKNKNSSL